MFANVAPAGNENAHAAAAQAAAPHRETSALKAFFDNVYRYLMEQYRPNMIDATLEAYCAWCRNVREGFKEHPDQIDNIVQEQALPFLQKKLKKPLKEPQGFHAYLLSNLPAVAVLRKVRMKHYLCQFLRELKTKLDASTFTDTTTNTIKSWHANFVEALRLEADPLDEIYNEFTKTLQRILQGPKFMPLDSEALWGSDGNTYGTKALKVILSGIFPIELRHRPPFDPNSPEYFYTQPHPVASYLVTWFEEHHGPLPGAKEVEEQFNEIEVGAMPIIPDARKARWRQIQDQKAVQDVAFAAMRNDAAVDPAVLAAEKELDDLAQEFKQVKAEEDARVEAMERVRAENLGAIRIAIQVHNEEIQNLDEANDELRKELNDLQADVDQVKREVVQLRIAVNETKKALEEREKGWLKSMLTSVAIMAACWCAGWAIQQGLQALGSSATAGVSTKGSTFMLDFKWSF